MSDLLKINVNEHTERKNGLTYLSWAWAWSQVLTIDPAAEWEPVTYPQPDGTCAPCMYVGGGTAMVKVNVTIKGKTRSCVLPVMDHRNKAIKDPDAFAINTAIMRCMTKAISMHGLGLYIYAGEDLPISDDDESQVPALQSSIEAAKTKKTGVVSDVVSQLPPLSPEDAAYFDELANDVENIFITSGPAAAFDRVELEELDNEQRIHLWNRLGSKVRSALKAEKGLRIGAA